MLEKERTRWSVDISDLAWPRLGVETAGLSELAVDREVFRVFLGLLPRDSFYSITYQAIP